MKTSRSEKPRRLLLAALMLSATLVAGEVAAEPIFASPPHVVSDDDGARIVLFLNEPVSGALAARAGSGYEVRVPRSAVAPAIQGQDFGADGWGNGGDAVKHLVLAAGAAGDTSIRIQPSGPVGGVDAHSVDDPPRLVIELLASAPTRTPAPTKTPGRSPSPARSAAAAKTKTAPDATPRPTATKAPKPKASATELPKPQPTATPAATSHEPVAIAAAPEGEVELPAHDTAMHQMNAPGGKMNAPGGNLNAPGGNLNAPGRDLNAPKRDTEPPTAEALARATVLTALAVEKLPPAERPSEDLLAAAAAATQAAAGTAPSARHDVAGPAAATAPAGASHDTTVKASDAIAPARGVAPAKSASDTIAAPTVAAAPFGLGCLWRRFGGLAICVADPKAPPYAGDHTIMALVGALARGKLPEPEDTPAVATPALAFLKADVLFATRAPEAKLLPVVDAYRAALRQHPEFPDAWRARLNVALAYRAMEFLTELRTVAREAAIDRSGGLVRGLAGDLAFVTGKAPIATEEYKRAADAGGLGACIAARGRARLAIAANDAATAAAELGSLTAICPPEIAGDAETVWVRGRLALAQHDFAAARTLLGEAQKGLGKYDKGAVIADLGAVAEAAGDAKAARESYDSLLHGAYGARAARQATVRLAILDGVGGDVTAGLKRLERLTPEAAGGARKSLVMQSARTALERGAPGAAIAALHDAHVDPHELPLEDQLVVARAYRAIGLGREAENLLAGAQARAGIGAAAAEQGTLDALFAERGTLAIERRDAGQGLAIADDWIRARGRNAGALGLKARAAALAGDGTAASAAVAAAVIEDPDLTRTLGLDVAELLRDRHPAVALVLAREALDPGPAPALPAEREAVGLALVGSLAEQAGDDDTALAAFTTLTARYGKEPIAADAAYRAARIAARRVPGGSAGVYDDAAKSKDPLARRMAGAAQKYEAIMKPLGGAPAPVGRAAAQAPAGRDAR